MIANLLEYMYIMYAKNYQNRERFDKDIAKIKRCSFLALNMLTLFINSYVSLLLLTLP